MNSTAIEVEAEALVERFSQVEKLKDELVKKVEDFFEQRQHESKEELPVKMTQLQNLMGRANETRSVKEIINFIRYQIGRDSKQKNWAKDEFGKQVINKIEEVADMASNNKEMSIRLVRLFLGYLQRHARYLKAGKPEEEEGEE